MTSFGKSRRQANHVSRAAVLLRAWQDYFCRAENRAASGEGNVTTRRKSVVGRPQSDRRLKARSGDLNLLGVMKGR